MKRKGKGEKKMDVKFQVLGFKDFKRKSDGKAMTVVTCMSPCTPQDNAYGAYGNKATDLFLPDDKVGTLTVNCIGQEFVPKYGLNGFGKPEIVDYELKAWK